MRSDDGVDPTRADPPHGAVRLRLTRPWVGDPQQAARLLSDDATAWLGRPQENAAPRGRRRYEADLALPIGGPTPRLALRKAALVELGDAEPDGAGIRFEVSWRSANLAPLFPVFVGTLRLASDRIDLDGYYAPPGGELGIMIDRALLNIAARGTARWFLTRVADAISGYPDDSWEASPAPDRRPTGG